MFPFSVRLTEAVQRKGCLCVGFDPRWEMLPTAIRMRHRDEGLTGVASAFRTFCSKLLELIEPYAGVVKPQSAFFELAGPRGLSVQGEILHQARELGLITILDAKRGDIASTATAYADAAFAGLKLEEHTLPIWNADSLTINPYLGRDAVEPFLNAAQAARRGVFVLVRTSNPGAGLFQDLVSAGKPLYQYVAEAVANWNAPTVTSSGLGDVGAVVGATHPEELKALRQLLPNVWFLIPGYGAQGGTAKDVKAGYLSNGLGAIVNSSRGVAFPFHPDDPDWEAKIVSAAKRASDELRP